MPAALFVSEYKDALRAVLYPAVLRLRCASLHTAGVLRKRRMESIAPPLRSGAFLFSWGAASQWRIVSQRAGGEKEERKEEGKGF